MRSPTMSRTASYDDDSWFSTDSDMTKAEYSRRLVDEHKLAQADRERFAKPSRAEQRAQQQRAAMERGRARVDAVREQRRAALEQVDAVRQANAKLAGSVRQQSARIERDIAASGNAHLEQKESDAAAARERQRQALAASRVEVFDHNVGRAREVRRLPGQPRPSRLCAATRAPWGPHCP